jgi:hypothetical protein
VAPETPTAAGSQERSARCSDDRGGVRAFV